MGSRILLADDSITIQKVVNLTFADEGIEVVAVSNGDLAERRLSEVKPDLVLADIFMPGKNGYELCEAIKQNPQFRNVPVVLLVGAFEPFDQAEARRVQADAHLTKPFESRTLVETVRRLISTSTQATTGPIAQMPSPGEGREDLYQAEPMPAQVTIPTAPKLDLSEMMAGQNVPPAKSSSIRTGELGSSQPDAAPQVFDTGVKDMPSAIEDDANSGGASAQFDPMELAQIGESPNADAQSSSVYDQSEMILDFDKAEPVESSAPLGPTSFQAEARFEEAESTMSSEGAEWFNKDLDSRAVETPSMNNARRQSAITAPLNGQAAAFRMRHEATSEGSTETACATMLAVDEPLGDLLLDEAVSSSTLPFGHDLLDIELTAPAAIEASATTDTQFDLVDTAADSSDLSQGSAAVENNIEDAIELPDTAPLRMIDQPDADAEGLLADSQADFVESDDILDWTTPNAGSHSTETLDPVMMPTDTPDSPVESVTMPIDTAPAPTENPTDKGSREVDSTQEASFESASMWPDEEARFAAIDIEAFPVEESEAPPQLEEAETGFSLSSVTSEQPGRGIEARATDATFSEQPANDAPSRQELSSATIEEIVRRVVAAMSESVVREVAWEVVPDCVERVIDQLTRESLSKRA